jgi:hypothetical protein
MIKQVSVETYEGLQAGERAGFTIEQMIELLNTGASVETLLTLIEWRLCSPAVVPSSSRWTM